MAHGWKTVSVAWTVNIAAAVIVRDVVGGITTSTTQAAVETVLIRSHCCSLLWCVTSVLLGCVPGLPVGSDCRVRWNTTHNRGAVIPG